jgi:cell division protein FtsB
VVVVDARSYGDVWNGSDLDQPSHVSRNERRDRPEHAPVEQIQNLMDENLALQEEIHTLKSDPKVIEREAKRLALSLKSE